MKPLRLRPPLMILEFAVCVHSLHTLKSAQNLNFKSCIQIKTSKRLESRWSKGSMPDPHNRGPQFKPPSRQYLFQLIEILSNCVFLKTIGTMLQTRQCSLSCGLEQNTLLQRAEQPWVDTSASMSYDCRKTTNLLTKLSTKQPKIANF